MDEITLSEETIKTNEAKCLAAKREKEAVEAQLKASKKEEEARGSIKMLFEVWRDNNGKSILETFYLSHIILSCIHRKCDARWRRCSDSCWSGRIS